MALAFRLGNIQPFVDVTSRDDDRYGSLQAGFVTYDEDDNYQVTYIEYGARCDHLADPLQRACGLDVDKLSASAPLASDERLMRSKPEPKADTKPVKAIKIPDVQSAATAA
tara:strand:+ start:170 stop:502 length:333 start_codon:yes stop_codon:yes gene_type:complete